MSIKQVMQKLDRNARDMEMLYELARSKKLKLFEALKDTEMLLEEKRHLWREYAEERAKRGENEG